jgi:hypothetical protein
MEIQLFAGDRLIFRTHPAEPLWELLPEGAIDREALQERVEAELRRLRPGAIADRGGYAEGEVDVAGERLRLSIRDPRNQALLRANLLHQALAESSGPLRAIAVPKLASRLFRLARLLKQTDGGVSAAELQARLLEHLQERERTETDADVLAGLRREAQALGDPRVVFDDVSQLRDAGLAEECDGTVAAAEKLRLIVI